MRTPSWAKCRPSSSAARPTVHWCWQTSAATVLQKPISRAALKKALTNLGFYDAQDQTYTVLVVDDDPKSVELIATYLSPVLFSDLRISDLLDPALATKRKRSSHLFSKKVA